MMNKFKRQNRRLRFYFSVINAAVVLSILSVTSFAQTIDVKNLEADLEPEIRRAMIEGNIPSATVALVSGDKVIWTGAYGESNLWARTPATVDTVYLIGSTFKAMSTAALLQQMEQGKFKLDDPVSKYLDFKIQGEDPLNPITFRHLFTHTSGLDGDFGAVPVWSNSAPTEMKVYLQTSLKVTHPPMTKVNILIPLLP
jgi:CubicO group peptidase (beta-lactamase class C family)